jgi:hypothetical protein
VIGTLEEMFRFKTEHLSPVCRGIFMRRALRSFERTFHYFLAFLVSPSRLFVQDPRAGNLPAAIKAAALPVRKIDVARILAAATFIALSCYL